MSDAFTPVLTPRPFIRTSLMGTPAGGDRVALLGMNDGHAAVCWAYGYPHSGMQLVSYEPERAEEVFKTTREQAEAKGGLTFDSRIAWQNGSV